MCQCQKVFATYNTLYFYNNEPSKNKHFLILLSNLARNSQEPKLKGIFEILWVFYSDWPKFWIWRTLGHVRNILYKCHLHNASKKVFWSKKCWISHMSSKVPFCQNWKLPKWHFWTSAWNSKKKPAIWLLLKRYEDDIFKKISLTCPRVIQIHDLGQSK